MKTLLTKGGSGREGTRKLQATSQAFTKHDYLLGTSESVIEAPYSETMRKWISFVDGEISLREVCDLKGTNKKDSFKSPPQEHYEICGFEGVA